MKVLLWGLWAETLKHAADQTRQGPSRCSSFTSVSEITEQTLPHTSYSLEWLKEPQVGISLRKKCKIHLPLYYKLLFWTFFTLHSFCQEMFVIFNCLICPSCGHHSPSDRSLQTWTNKTKPVRLYTARDKRKKLFVILGEQTSSWNCGALKSLTAKSVWLCNVLCAALMAHSFTGFSSWIYIHFFHLNTPKKTAAYLV